MTEGQTLQDADRSLEWLDRTLERAHHVEAHLTTISAAVLAYSFTQAEAGPSAWGRRFLVSAWVALLIAVWAGLRSRTNILLVGAELAQFRIALQAKGAADSQWTAAIARDPTDHDALEAALAKVEEAASVIERLGQSVERRGKIAKQIDGLRAVALVAGLLLLGAWRVSSL